MRVPAPRPTRCASAATWPTTRRHEHPASSSGKLLVWCHGPEFPELIRGKCVQVSMLWRIGALSLFAAFSASAQPEFPDTPAGRTLKAWFEAFNSGDRARIEAYIQKFDPARPIDNQMNFRNQTGGFDLF